MKKIFSLLMISFLFGAVLNGKNVGANSELAKTKSPVPATRVYFSNEVPLLGIAKESKEFFIKPEGGFAYLIVDNYPDNFAYDQVQVKVYKSINGTSQSYDNKTYNISTGNYYTYIKYDFYSTGYYIFDVYNKYGTFLGTATVTINNQTGSSSAAASPSGSSGSTYNGDCITGYKEYYTSSYGFAMCIPKDCYTTESTTGKDGITINNFYGHKVEVTFMEEPIDGLDKFDLSVVNLTRDYVKSLYSSYYRSEFKLLSSKGDIAIYRSVTKAVPSSGATLQSSVFYVKMYGKKIRGHDYMLLSGPFVENSSDVSYQIIIELGMLAKLKIY